MAFTAGQRLTAAKLQTVLPTSYEAKDAVGGTTASTSYTSTGTFSALSVSFTAPDSGIVVAFINVTQSANVSANIYSGCQISGDFTITAADSDAAHSFSNNQFFGGARIVRYTSLTPGTTYTATMQHRVTANTGTFQERTLLILTVN